MQWKPILVSFVLALGACAVHEHDSLVQLQKIDREIERLEDQIKQLSKTENGNPITLELQQKEQLLQSLKIQRSQAVARVERVHKEAQEIAAKDQREAQRRIDAGGEPEKGLRLHYGAD
jgi:hypothetical protein